MRAFPGTAPCDWLPKLAVEWQSAHQPPLVELAFVGGHVSACSDRPTETATMANYRRTLEAMVAWLTRRRVSVVLSGPPAMQAQRYSWLLTDTRRLRVLYRDIARRHCHTVRYRDNAARAVSPGLAYAERIRGSRVRLKDGIHLTDAGANLLRPWPGRGPALRPAPSESPSPGADPGHSPPEVSANVPRDHACER